MSEIYNFEKEDRKGYSWFMKYLLGSPKESLTALVNSEGYDSSKLEVCLTINGIPQRIDDFNHLLDKWSDMVEEQVKKELDYIESERAVLEKAEELIKNKLGNIQDVLYDVENSLWKLSQEE
jgi:uncharacterized protein YydD (DUF2326 family)